MDEWQTNDNPRIALDTKAVEELIEGKQLEKVFRELKEKVFKPRWRSMIMRKVIQIKVPEEIGVLMDSDPVLKNIVEKIVERDVIEYILTILTMDKLTSDSTLTEEEILEIDKKIKKIIRERE